MALKISITTDKLKKAKPKLKKRFALVIDATELDYQQIAMALLELAGSLETNSFGDDACEKLRDAVAARDPELQTTTRLKLEAPIVFKIHADGREVGVAKLSEEKPAPVIKARARAHTHFPTRGHTKNIVPTQRQFFYEEEEEEEVEDVWEYDKHELVEVCVDGIWIKGTVAGQTEPDYYEVDDDYGRLREYHTRMIRPIGVDDEERPW